MTFIFETPNELQEKLAQKFRQLRVFRNLGRKKLAQMSGVPEPTIKRFERTGEISLRTLLNLAHVLNVLDQFDTLLTLPAAKSLAEIEMREERLSTASRKRGRN